MEVTSEEILEWAQRQADKAWETARVLNDDAFSRGRGDAFDDVVIWIRNARAKPASPPEVEREMRDDD
jgi:hypothetical protein